MKFMDFAVGGFKDKKLTLPTASYCFQCLCMHCAPVLTPFTSSLAEQILTQDFVA